MSKRVLASSVFAVGMVAAGGCHGGALSLSYHDSRPVVYDDHVHVGHVCSRHCNHYWDGSSLVVVKAGHRHGPGCGHVWSGKRWVISTHKAPARHHGHRDVHIRGPRGGEIHVRHEHGPGCGHVYDRRGSKWIVVGHGHVHGPGCGHAYISGRWTIRY